MGVQYPNLGNGLISSLAPPCGEGRGVGAPATVGAVDRSRNSRSNASAFSGPPATNSACSRDHTSGATVERDCNMGSGVASPGRSASLNVPLAASVASCSTPYGQYAGPPSSRTTTTSACDTVFSTHRSTERLWLSRSRLAHLSSSDPARSAAPARSDSSLSAADAKTSGAGLCPRSIASPSCCSAPACAESRCITPPRVPPASGSAGWPRGRAAIRRSPPQPCRAPRPASTAGRTTH